MPLLELWKSNPSAIEQFSIEQIVISAGDGSLKDDSLCSSELRAFLSQVSTSKLRQYVEKCLSTPLNKGGLVLQDLINELGRRLEYTVENGRYQGVAGKNNFDGFWLSNEGHAIVVEVKTTDTYRISLETIVGYLSKFRVSGRILGTASMLIVTGREDTGELEAQVRGSRHAWDIRLISTDALIRLVQLKEESESAETGIKIRSLLTPREYTRLDAMIDVMFTTTKDVVSAVEAGLSVDDETESPVQVVHEKSDGTSGWEFTDRTLLQGKRNEVFRALALREKTVLIAKSLATYWNADHTVRAVCTISKRYTSRQHPYWYAYHPRWQTFLDEASRSFIVFACMDKQAAYAVPADVMHKHLPALRTTDDKYWHVDLSDAEDGHVEMFLAKTREMVSLTPYALPLGALSD
jgi:hypothetical protein